jgi:iron(III) transport system ATP-binding protein
VRLTAPDEPSAQLRGEVRDVAFAGRGYEHVIDLQGEHRLTGVFDLRRWERGSRVGISLDPAGSLLFGSAQAAPASVEPESIRS